MLSQAYSIYKIIVDIFYRRKEQNVIKHHAKALIHLFYNSKCSFGRKTKQFDL
jgi:hypothetical protein